MPIGEDGQRAYPTQPIVGVGAVVWRAGQVLLVQRAKAPRAGQWALPGGRQKLGETLFETAVREVREETAIAISPTHVITALDMIERDGQGVRYHYTLIEIAGVYVSGEITPGDDASAAAWFEPGAIAGLDAWEQVERVVSLSRAST